MPYLARRLECSTLSRGGLADLVAALGRAERAARRTGAAFAAEGARAEGQALLAGLLGGGEHLHALAARTAALTGIGEDTVREMLPSLTALLIARVAARANGGIAAILKLIPPLGCAACGSPHADLAGILRRRCGLGPYAARRLRKVVRTEVARAGGFPARGALAWYASFMLRPLLAPLRALVHGLLLELRPTFEGERRRHTPVHPPSLRES